MKRSVASVGCGMIVTVVVATSARLIHGQAPAQTPSGAPGIQMMDPRRDTGQTVAPVFEGWEPNPDGTVSMYFGYMNRNWKEELDIPIGPNNSFDPAPIDRGQPTHFLPRRGKQIFAVVVPKGFKQTITWTLTIRGNTERIPASLKPEQQIDVSKDTQNGNIVRGFDNYIKGTVARRRAAISDADRAPDLLARVQEAGREAGLLRRDADERCDRDRDERERHSGGEHEVGRQQIRPVVAGDRDSRVPVERRREDQ